MDALEVKNSLACKTHISLPGTGLIVLFLVLFLFAVDSPASCYTSDYGFELSGRDGCQYGTGCSVSTCANTQQCRAVANGCPAVRRSGACYWSNSRLTVPLECQVDSYPSGCASTGGGYPQCYYSLCCSDQRSADSANCVIAGNTWISSSLTCLTQRAQDSLLCINAGNEWISAGNGRCKKVCSTRSCCDSLNITEPLPYDTTELGCKSMGGGDYPCVETHQYDLNGQVVNTTYQCDGVFNERVCTTQYTFSGAGQCAPLPTTNCVEITNVTKTQERCHKVSCVENWENELHSFTFNSSTQCYEGTYRVMTYMVCSNGDRTFPTYGSMKTLKVCQNLLDSLGMDIGEYLEGDYSGSTGEDATGAPVVNSGGLSLGGSGGLGNGGGGTSGGTSGGGSGSGSGGGEGGEGGAGNDEPYVGPMIPLTEYDSTTGQIQIVQNSQGGDSLVPANVTYGARCIGVSNGVATMSDGRNTWSCTGVQSCVQAELKYKLGTGCGGNAIASDVDPNRPQMTWSDSVTHDNGIADYTDVLNGLSRFATFMYSYFSMPSTYKSFADAIDAVVTTLNGGTERARMQRDSLYDAAKNELWKETFGNDLSNVTQIKDGVWVLKDSVHAINGSIGAQTTALSGAIGDASTGIRTSIGNAANTVSSNLGASLTNVETSIGTGFSDVRDTLRAMHGTQRTIRELLDTGGIIQVDVSSMRDTLHAMHGTVSDYYTMLSEQTTLMGNLTQAFADSSSTTNTVLRDIRDALGAAPSSSSVTPVPGSSASADADSSYSDTLDYALDSSLLEGDSIISEKFQSISDSVTMLTQSFKQGMDSVLAHVDSVRADTNNNRLAMDSIYKWNKDTTVIKQKMSKLFLPSQVSNNCFACTYNEQWWMWNVDLRIDFGNVYGFNVCAFLRLLVRVAVSIFIIFSTIAAFIRAFGGGGGGSP